MNRDQEERRDNLMRLARMANFIPVDHFYVTDVFLEKFAEMVAAAEREACAKVCEERKSKYEERASKPENARNIDPEVARIAKMTCDFNADAIRARGETECEGMRWEHTAVVWTAPQSERGEK